MSYMYLADYIGTGTFEAPFRPVGSDQPGWSAIDLRGDATSAASGKAFLLLPEQSTDKGLYALGDDPDAELPAKVREGVEDRVNLARGDLPDVVRGRKDGEKVASGVSMLADLLTLFADDDDPARPNVLRPERDKMLRIRLGGQVWWEKAVPAGGATHTESWSCADSASISCDLTWTDVVNALSLVSNGVEPTNDNAPGVSRAEHDLGSADHYAEAVSDGAMDGSSSSFASDLQAALVRFSPTATTYYECHQRGVNGGEADETKLVKVVSGSSTDLATGSNSYTVGQVIRGEAEGSTVRLLFDGAENLSVTDTGITGNLRTGIRLYSRNNRSAARFTSFEAGDLGGVTGPLLRTSGGYLRTASGILRPA